MNVMLQTPILIALGGNLPSKAGPPEATLRAALDLLTERDVAVEAVSRFYDTPCFPPGAGPDYVNAAVRVGFAGSAAELLTRMHDVETEFGRARETRWGRRTLDLDLIAMGDAILPDVATQRSWRDLDPEEQRRVAPDRLILPHPRLQERGFVLIPLLDVAPGWRHPVEKLTVREMAENLPKSAVKEVIAR